MFCEAWPDLRFFIFTSKVPALLYYSHIPTVLITLAIGFFVYFKNKNLLASRILLLLSIAFFMWTSIDLILWVNPDSRVLMLLWSFLGIISSLIYFLCLYFVYAFIDKKDISFRKKVTLGILLLPVIIFTPTSYNLDVFNITDCGANGLEGKYFTSYYFLLGVIVFIWIAILSFKRYRKAQPELKRQIIPLAIGIELFLLSFFSTGFLASYLVWTGASKDFATTQYGLFGMTVFMGFLAYLIVKFKAFNIKLFGAQFLVAFLMFFVGSLLFIGNISTMRVIVWITLAIALAIGLTLVKSVKKEIEQREALEIANKEITERKEELQKISDSLAIANDKLRQLDQAKSDFINIASHQLKKAPTPIKGYASLLLEGSYGKLAPEQAETIKKIETANERQINLVEDLLNVARIESGRMEFKFEKINPAMLCQEVYDNLATIARDKGLDFQYEKPEKTLPEILVDKGKIFEAVFNFAENAIKYTPSGSVKLKVEQAVDNIRISVTDTGIGIHKEDLPSLFEKFTRGKDTSRLHTEGSGLGLYVVRLMIEAHGGRTWAESDGEGKGSRFIIEIPIKQPEELLKQQS